MAKTTVSCPNCRQPIAADITQIFDVSEDPQAKQILLSGTYNLVQCPNCGYAGQVPMPIVYHDPNHDMLLTFFPPELNVPVNQQEQMIGPLIQKIMENQPIEKRKAYFLNPETMLTRQRLVERILEEDGITPEMLKEQQDRLNFLQRLAGISPESQPEVIRQEEELVDEQLLMILQQLIQSTAATGDEKSTHALVHLQQTILENTAFGQQVLTQVRDQQAAMEALDKASKEGLTRESLLDLIIDAGDSEIKLVTLVSMARAGLDYGFFQLLTDRIQEASGEDQAKLIELRDNLLKMTHDIDKAIKEQEELATEILERILAEEDIEEATLAALPEINEIFLEVLRARIQAARKTDDQTSLDRLQKIASAIQKISAPGANIELIETLIEAPDESAIQAILNENADEISDDFSQFLFNLVNQTQQQEGQEATVEKLRLVYRQVLRFTMKKNLEKPA